MAPRPSPLPVAFCNLQTPGTLEKQKSGAFQTARRGGSRSLDRPAELHAPWAQGQGPADRP